MELCKRFLVSLLSGGRIFGGLIFGVFLGSQMTCLYQKIPIRCTIEETMNNILCIKCSEKDSRICKGSTHAPYMIIHCPNYAH